MASQIPEASRDISASSPKSSQPLISFVVPCYNAADYLDTCVSSILTCPGEYEVILINDGSTADDTSARIHRWADSYPDRVMAIDQENKGHGGAINTGLSRARGVYVKVVDSDDWLDEISLVQVVELLKEQSEQENPVDMFVANYVYEQVHDDLQVVMDYRRVFPERQVCTWDEVGRFAPSQYLIMHSIIYRTELLRDCGLRLPEHCFYVDNIFVYVPLPHVKTIMYLDVPLYRYFIGREDQSVNESVMLGRIDQHLRVVRILIDEVKLPDPSLNPHLERYLINYLSMMMCIATVFLRMKTDDESRQAYEEIWAYLRATDKTLYDRVRRHVINVFTTLPTKIGRRFSLFCYHMAHRVFKFN